MLLQIYCLIIAQSVLLVHTRLVKREVKISSPLDRQVDLNGGSSKQVITPIPAVVDGASAGGQTGGRGAWQGTPLNTAPQSGDQPFFPGPGLGSFPNGGAGGSPFGNSGGQGFPGQFGAGGPQPFGGSGSPPPFFSAPGAFPNSGSQGPEASGSFSANPQQQGPSSGGPEQNPPPGFGPNFGGSGFGSGFGGPVGAVATNGAFPGPGGRRLFLLEEPTVDPEDSDDETPPRGAPNGFGSPFFGPGPQGFSGAGQNFHFVPLNGQRGLPFGSPFGVPPGAGGGASFPFRPFSGPGRGQQAGEGPFGESNAPGRPQGGPSGGFGGEQGPQGFGGDQRGQGFGGGQGGPGFGGRHQGAQGQGFRGESSQGFGGPFPGAGGGFSGPSGGGPNFGQNVEDFDFEPELDSK